MTYTCRPANAKIQCEENLGLTHTTQMPPRWGCALVYLSLFFPELSLSEKLIEKHTNRWKFNSYATQIVQTLVIYSKVHN